MLTSELGTETTLSLGGLSVQNVRLPYGGCAQAVRPWDAFSVLVNRLITLFAAPLPQQESWCVRDQTPCFEKQETVSRRGVRFGLVLRHSTHHRDGISVGESGRAVSKRDGGRTAFFRDEAPWSLPRVQSVLGKGI